MFQTIAGFFKGVREQITAIQWPKRQLVIYNGVIVIISILIAILVVIGIDYGFSKFINWYISLK
jgi:preprotein translocase SecE subunit